MMTSWLVKLITLQIILHGYYPTWFDYIYTMPGDELVEDVITGSYEDDRLTSVRRSSDVLKNLGGDRFDTGVLDGEDRLVEDINPQRRNNMETDLDSEGSSSGSGNNEESGLKSGNVGLQKLGVEGNNTQRENNQDTDSESGIINSKSGNFGLDSSQSLRVDGIKKRNNEESSSRSHNYGPESSIPNEKSLMLSNNLENVPSGMGSTTRDSKKDVSIEEDLLHDSSRFEFGINDLLKSGSQSTGIDSAINNSENSTNNILGSSTGARISVDSTSDIDPLESKLSKITSSGGQDVSSNFLCEINTSNGVTNLDMKDNSTNEEPNHSGANGTRNLLNTNFLGISTSLTSGSDSKPLLDMANTPQESSRKKNTNGLSNSIHPTRSDKNGNLYVKTPYPAKYEGEESESKESLIGRKIDFVITDHRGSDFRGDTAYNSSENTSINLENDLEFENLVESFDTPSKRSNTTKITRRGSTKDENDYKLRHLLANVDNEIKHTKLSLRHSNFSNLKRDKNDESTDSLNLNAYTKSDLYGNSYSANASGTFFTNDSGELDTSSRDLKQFDDMDLPREIQLADKFNRPSKVTASDDYTNEDLRRVNDLATIFLDTRKLLKSDHNVVDPIVTDQIHLKSILRSSIIRAGKVKTMLALKYMYIQRQYDWTQSQDQDTIHPSLDGVYNPIQIIRNRKIRQKYHEYPKPLNIKTIPLASTMFSKHSKPKKPYKMTWSIELNEFIQDKAWRADHLSELVDPKGNLWFTPSKVAKKEKRHRRKSRLHDKLFDEVDKSYKELSSAENSDRSLVPESTKKSRRKRVSDKVRRHSRKSYNSSSSYEEAGSLGDMKAESEAFNKSPPLKQRMLRPSAIDQNLDACDFNQYSRTLSETAVPQIKIETVDKAEPNTSIENIIQIPIKPIEKLDDSPDFSEVEDVNEEKCQQILAGRDVELITLVKHFKFISANLKLKKNYLVNVYPYYLQRVNDRMDYIKDHQIHKIMNSTVKINDYYLQIFESLFLSFSEEIQGVAHLINDEHSVKVDNLLSTSDRSIGEINISLTSEVRKVSERIDKLKDTLVDRKVIQRGKDDSKFKLKLHDGNYKTLYYVLESVIVILLRLVWVAVNIYKLCTGILKFIMKAIKLILF